MSIISSQLAIRLVEQLVTVGVATASLEFVSLRREFAAGGVFDSQLLAGGDAPGRRRAVSGLLDTAIRNQRFVFWMGIRFAAAAFLCIFGASGVLETALLLLLLLLSLTVSLRAPFGLEGAEQMILIVLATLVIASFAPANQKVQLACLWFISLQSCLAYVTAGIAKARKEVWRDGAFLASYLRTDTYSRPVLSKLRMTSRVIRPLAIAVIGFECGFILSLIGPRTAVVILAAGVLFHLVNAMVTGLNIFVWAFVSTYPAVLYCAGWPA
jgi:hypothetical protein